MAAGSVDLRAQHDDLLRTLGQHLAEIAHELRAPLAGMRGQLQLMERNLIKANYTAQQWRFELLYGEIARMGEMLEQYLQLTCRRMPAPQPLLLENAISQVLELLRGMIIAQNIHCDLCLTPGLPKLMADERQIKQVLINLIINAVEASGTGGQLRLRLSAVDGWQCVEVIDNGPGMDAETLSHIWEPFFTTKQEGTGLGLVIARQIAEEHGGRLEVSSKPGTGSCFCLSLPPGS